MAQISDAATSTPNPQSRTPNLRFMSIHLTAEAATRLGRSGRAAGAVHRHVGQRQRADAGRVSAAGAAGPSPDGAGRAGQGRSGAADARGAAKSRSNRTRPIFPELLENGEPPCDLIYEEYHIRRTAGDTVTPRDYYERFPKSADALRRLMGTDDFSATTQLALAATDRRLCRRPEARRFRSARRAGQRGVWQRLSRPADFDAAAGGPQALGRQGQRAANARHARSSEHRPRL